MREHIADNDEYLDHRKELKERYDLPLSAMDAIWKKLMKARQRAHAEAMGGDGNDTASAQLAEALQRGSRGALVGYCSERSTLVVGNGVFPMSGSNNSIVHRMFGLVPDREQNLGEGEIGIGTFLHYVNNHHAIHDWIHELSGWSAGIHDINNKRILVLTAAAPPEAAEGDRSAWKWFLDHLIPDADQRHALKHTLARIRRGLMEPGPPRHRPIAANIVVGPRDAGKTLLATLSSHIVYGSENGIADPIQYFTGDTQFNAHLAEKPLLVSDDHKPFADKRIAKRLGDNIKTYTASNQIEVHAKGKKPWMANTVRAVFMVMNDDYDSLGAAPAMRETIEDKVHLIKTARGTPDSPFVKQFIAELFEQIPAFCHHLDNEVPEGPNPRWGINVVQSLEIRKAIFNVSEAGVFAEVLGDLLFPDEGEPAVEGKVGADGVVETLANGREIHLAHGDYILTAQQIRELISATGGDRRQGMREAIQTARAVGRQLWDISRAHPELVGRLKRTMYGSKKLWFVRRKLIEER
jgi:hypothetical protein